MKGELLVAALLVTACVAIGIEMNSIGTNSSEYCPDPSAVSVEALFAPCQTFDSAMVHPVSKQEAKQMGLLSPEEQPAPNQFAFNRGAEQVR